MNISKLLKLCSAFYKLAGGVVEVTPYQPLEDIRNKADLSTLRGGLLFARKLAMTIDDSSTRFRENLYSYEVYKDFNIAANVIASSDKSMFGPENNARLTQIVNFLQQLSSKLDPSSEESEMSDLHDISDMAQDIVHLTSRVLAEFSSDAIRYKEPYKDDIRHNYNNPDIPISHDSFAEKQEKLEDLINNRRRRILDYDYDEYMRGPARDPNKFKFNTNPDLTDPDTQSEDLPSFFDKFQKKPSIEQDIFYEQSNQPDKPKPSDPILMEEVLRRHKKNMS